MLFRIFADGIEQSIVEAPQTGDVGAAFAKMLLTFGALIFLLFATYWIVKKLVRVRLERGSSTSSISILERRMLSPKTMLYIVEHKGKQILITESQAEIKKIDTLDL